MWRASVLTLFPEMFPGPLGISLVGKALADGLWSLDVHDIRSSGLGKHRTVDDTPAGGGPGMVMRADVAAAAINAVTAGSGPSRPLLCLSPRGTPLVQERVRELAEGTGAILFCARFEGVDERIIRARRMEEVSLGDFVLAGGEVAAMALIEACVRLMPGVMGAGESAAEESFEQGLLEYPQFTRPQTFEGADIPPVLVSGDHAAVARWRRQESERLTRERRPDLWTLYEKRVLSARRPASSPEKPPDGGKK
jgi:tRNA (guanine37-N1)-methyltransferase